MKCGKHTETLGAGQGELRVGPCGALTQQSLSTWRGGLSENGQAIPCTEGVAGLSRRIFSKRKRLSGHFGEFSCSSSSSLLSTGTPTWHSHRGVGDIKPKS